jgi:septal ring factor EnvC (AmiA/AmiB activator)
VAGDWSAAGIAAAITGIGFAVVGLATYAIKQINIARIDARRAWDEANRSSLEVQVKELTANIATLRRSLHDSRNEATAREDRLKLAADALADRHAEEVERWAAEFEIMHRTNRLLNAEVVRLSAHVVELTRATDSVRASLSGDNLPTIGGTTRSLPGPPP